MKEDAKTRALVFGVYGAGNMGDDLMEMRVAEKMKARGVEPVFIVRPAWKHYFGLTPETFSSVRFPLRENYGGAGKIAKAADYAKYFAAERNFGKMSAAIFIGGGYTSDEFKNLYKTGYLRDVMRKKHVPVWFTGQTAGPARTPETREKLRRIYSGAEGVFVREKWSEEFLSALGVESRLTGDDAFLGSRGGTDGGRVPGQPYLVAVYKDFPGYEQYKESFFTAVRETAARLGLAVAIVPFRREPETEEQRVSRALASFLADAGISSRLVCPGTPDAMEALFRGAALTLGTAYHAVVLSLKNGTPALGAYGGLYYKIKIRGIFDLYPREVRHAAPLSEFAQLARRFSPSDREREAIAKASAGIGDRVNAAWDAMLEKMITV